MTTRRPTLALASLAGACAVVGQAAVAAPRVVHVERWTVNCFPADDEFSVGCRATATRDGVSAVLSTGDSQLFAWVKVEGCPESDYANWRRDEILLEKDRRARVVKALNAKLAESAQTCPAAREVRLTFDWVPDIASVGDPPPRWVRMRGKPK